MDYENYIELYEAIYFLDKINCWENHKIPKQLNKEEIKRLGLNQSIYTAIVRILVGNDLLEDTGNYFVLTDAHKAKHHYILDHIISKDYNNHYAELYRKGIKENQFFFDSISEAEYEIYSRYNFKITSQIGKEVAKHLNLENTRVLELGGNSGGLATTLLTTNTNCLYTIVDTKIPCTVGREFSQLNNLDITFREGNIFELNLGDEVYDEIILMNLIHDFDDSKSLDILRSCINHANDKTKIILIEDVLTDEFEPKEVVMHGLRLAVECRGGKQRTIKELEGLFSGINYQLEEVIKINNVHTMVIMEAMRINLLS